MLGVAEVERGAGLRRGERKEGERGAGLGAGPAGSCGERAAEAAGAPVDLACWALGRFRRFRHSHSACPSRTILLGA